MQRIRLRRVTLTALATLAALATTSAACGGDAAGGAMAPSPDADASAAPAPAPAPAAPAPAADAGADAAPPPCPSSPCAARPIVFVHGFRGDNATIVPLFTALTEKDARFDGYHLSGTQDHAAYKTRSIGRRAWLFAIDYYNATKDDEPGAYTAGPGRIGSNGAFSCPSPSGRGNLLADEASYETGTTHDYAADLASMIDDVLRATGASSVDLIAHSMGGLVTRSYLAYYGGAAKVDNVLLLSSPVEGVGAVVLLEYVGIGQPSWMKAHEIAELDSGSVLSKTRFVRCGEAFEAKGAWAEKLLATEKAAPPRTAFYAMNGSLDYVTYAMSDHPFARSHDVAPGATHAGILKADETRAKVTALLGGSVK